MEEKSEEILTCCLCGMDITHEMFPNGGYMGNNPAPLAGPSGGRCCDWCNSLKVTPSRMGLVGHAAESLGRTLVIHHAVQKWLMENNMGPFSKKEEE